MTIASTDMLIREPTFGSMSCYVKARNVSGNQLIWRKHYDKFEKFLLLQ